ncbi:uncharacterized protein LOC131931256 isoform X2 [Physella acuta]|uniref:uncharacterized protein LOC131931256 isoform X2 n=1 Tax=Physella acuta TaxID=109671 RepID=UPI0027DDF5CE|nr:uncharacterized protein LOC131931256 isoform X2 [Physella acuta]
MIIYYYEMPSIEVFINLMFLILESARLLEGQSVTLSYSATPNSCTDGDLLEGVDVITLTGEINLEGQNSTDWNLDIPFQFRKNGALQFQTLCTVHMSSYCQTDGSECYCTARSGNVYHFTFTRLAALWLSNSTAMTELAKLNTTDVIRAYTDVPVIHGKEVVRLSKDGKSFHLYKSSIELDQNKVHTFEFCVANLKNPVLKMQFGSEIIPSQHSQCILHRIEANAVWSNKTCIISYTDDCHRSRFFAYRIVRSIQAPLAARITSSDDPVKPPKNLMLLAMGLGLGFTIVIFIGSVMIMKKKGHSNR